MALNDSASGVAPLGGGASSGQHVRALQAALDQARRLGHAIQPPVLGRDGGASSTSSGMPATGTRRGMEGRAQLPPSRFDELIRSAAAREGVDPALVKAVVQAESGGNPNAVSAAGAKGLMQLMDGTARSLGVANPMDPVQNVAGGVKYLKQLLGKYGGDATRALAAYNAGPGAVDAYGGVPPYSETRGYVQRVLALRDQIRPGLAGGSGAAGASAPSGQIRPSGR